MWWHSIAAVALIFALGDLPYGYYQFLRLLVSPAFLISAVVAFRCGLAPNGIVAILIGLLFNPIEPVHLPRGVWAFVDVMVAAGGMLLVARVYLPVFELRETDSDQP